MLTPAAARHEGRLRRPAGYAALVERHGLAVIPNWHASYVLSRGVHRREADGDSVVEAYPASYWPGDGFGHHLEFALKYDGTGEAREPIRHAVRGGGHRDGTGRRDGVERPGE